MENYVNNITFQIKLQIKEIILFAYCKFKNAWKFTPYNGSQNYPL